MSDTPDAASVLAAVQTFPPKTAKLAAIEILLTDPESLHDDVLESALYILRERLQEP